MEDFPMDEAMEMIAACRNEAELADVKALLLGKNSLLKQMEKALWAKPKAKPAASSTEGRV